MLGARSGQAEPARIASGEAADRRSTLISYFGHDWNHFAPCQLCHGIPIILVQKHQLAVIKHAPIRVTGGLNLQRLTHLGTQLRKGSDSPLTLQLYRVPDADLSGDARNFGANSAVIFRS